MIRSLLIVFSLAAMAATTDQLNIGQVLPALSGKTASSFSYALTCSFNCAAAASAATTADCHAHHN